MTTLQFLQHLPRLMLALMIRQYLPTRELSSNSFASQLCPGISAGITFARYLPHLRTVFSEKSSGPVLGFALSGYDFVVRAQQNVFDVKAVLPSQLMSSHSNGSSGERHIQTAVSALRGAMFGHQAKSM